MSDEAATKTSWRVLIQYGIVTTRAGKIRRKMWSQENLSGFLSINLNRLWMIKANAVKAAKKKVYKAIMLLMLDCPRDYWPVESYAC